MENSRLFRQANTVTSDGDSVICSLISEIDDLEQERDALKEKIEELEEKIQNM